MSSVRYVAMYGDLQISAVPHRLRWVAEQDKARWDKEHPDKPATIVEVKSARPKKV